jgi:hypothetical protein
MRRFLWVALFVPLAACIEAEAEIFVGEDESLTSNVTLNLSRQLYDMVGLTDTETGPGLCPEGSEKIIGPETVLCNFTEVSTIETAMEDAEDLRSEDEFLKDFKIERLDDETLKLVLPLEFDQIENKPAELSVDNPTFGIIASALEGRNMTFRINALEIVSSNGDVSEDGKSVMMVIPVVELLTQSGELPPEFTAVLKYRECGLLGC